MLRIAKRRRSSACVSKSASTKISTVSSLAPAIVAAFLFGVPAPIARSADEGETNRLKELADGLLPAGARRRGTAIDFMEAFAPTPCNVRSISCPVLAVSARDDLFGTDLRAASIAGAVAQGKVILYPTGGHALVGRQAETFADVSAFLNQTRRH